MAVVVGAVVVVAVVVLVAVAVVVVVVVVVIIVSNLTKVSFSYFLILIEPLQCAFNNSQTDLTVTEGTNVTFTCSAIYSGLWAPKITFNLGSGSSIPASDVITNSTVVYYETNFNATYDMNHQMLNCNLLFDAPPDGTLPPNTVSTTYDRSAPTYTDSCYGNITVYRKLIIL